MANSGLSALIPSAYKALDVVSRELVGFVPAVTLDADVARAAVGQDVISFTAPASSATDITPGVVPPNDGDQTLGNTRISITKARRVPFRWNGEEERGLNNNGAGAEAIKNNQIAQAIRTLVNEMESDVYLAARVAASRAVGVVGTTPFATNLGDSAQVRKILDDNGAPQSGRSLIIDTTAGANMRTQSQLTKANEAGTQMTLRDGELLNLHGFSVKESAAIVPVVKGTGAGYVVSSGGGYAAGTTDLTVGTGTGTILAGDVIVFAGDTTKYVVAAALSGGVVKIAAPGLRFTVANNAAITVLGNFTANVAFSKSAVVLAARQPALPKDGDLARDRATIVDPRSGMAFEIAMYPQYRQMQYEISIAWGVKGIKGEHIAILFG